MTIPTNVFVIRDFEVDQYVGLALQYLAKNPPTENTTVNVLGIPGAAEQGRIVADVVVPGIMASKYVIAFMDTPNANVGFELGFAIGTQRPVALVCASATLPDWLSAAPLAGYLVSLGVQLPKLARIIAKGEYIPLPRAPKSGEDVLFLAPRRDEGLVGHELVSAQYKQWRRPSETGWTLEDLPRQLDGVGEVIWLITPYAPESDRRDGQANSLNAVIAGYAKGAGIPLRVLKSTYHRALADVKDSAQQFEHLHELEALLAQAEAKRQIKLSRTKPATQDEAKERTSTLEAVIQEPSFRKPQWLEQGRRMSAAVGRLAKDGQAVASCFLVSPKHVLIPWHVADTVNAHEGCVVDFEVSREQRSVAKVIYTGGDLDHDFTILELEPAMPEDAVYVPLRPVGVNTDTRVTVVGYPGGGALSMSMADTGVSGFDRRFLYYRTPTQPGSGGSPLFDQQWQLVGMHIGKHTEGSSWTNHGIRIDFIVDQLHDVEAAQPVLAPTDEVILS